VCVSGRQLLLKAVARVWTELMHSKRSMLEDIFKVSLPSNDRGHVDVTTARPALEEQALRSWHNHLSEGTHYCSNTIWRECVINCMKVVWHFWILLFIIIIIVVVVVIEDFSIF